LVELKCVHQQWYQYISQMMIEKNAVTGHTASSIFPSCSRWESNCFL